MLRNFGFPQCSGLAGYQTVVCHSVRGLGSYQVLFLAVFGGCELLKPLLPAVHGGLRRCQAVFLAVLGSLEGVKLFASRGVWGLESLPSRCLLQCLGARRMGRNDPLGGSRVPAGGELQEAELYCICISFLNRE